eukprot:754762-Hanusia_phi.AAC.6
MEADKDDARARAREEELEQVLRCAAPYKGMPPLSLDFPCEISCSSFTSLTVGADGTRTPRRAGRGAENRAHACLVEEQEGQATRG